MTKHTNIDWWCKLDQYWLRYFKILINKDFHFDRKSREEFTPDEEQVSLLLQKTSIDLSNVSISNFTPLYALDNLEELSCTGVSSLKSIDGVSYLVKLRFFSLYDSKVSDISQLKQLKYLTSLSLGGSPIENLEKLPFILNLRELTINELPINNVKDISNTIQLEKLKLQRLTISDLTPLSNLKNLKDLEISLMDLENLHFLNELNNLCFLKFTYVKLERLKSIPSLPNLLEVEFSISNLKEIGSLIKWDKLNILNIVDTKLSSLHFLDSNQNITKLFITENNFSKNEIKRFINLHPNCEIVGEYGVHFPFNTYQTYELLCDFTFNGEHSVKAGTKINFVRYTYDRHRDNGGVDFYSFIVVDNSMTLLYTDTSALYAWGNYDQVKQKFSCIFRLIPDFIK